MSIEELRAAHQSAQRCRDNNHECAAWANKVIVLVAEVQRLQRALRDCESWAFNGRARMTVTDMLASLNNIIAACRDEPQKCWDDSNIPTYEETKR